ncbi:P27 family phage terminase small subunit [Tyzzerella sp. OttesenSCG-928-J15]|nr:P27 family phage terminase small subunit [Tyzzerella sp. OttesenSCG-928-J15]
MGTRAITKETIKKNTVNDMKKLGVYRPEYTPLVDIYCELREQYERLTAQYKKGGYGFEMETVQGGTKKAPIVATLESLRKDILAYSDRLCLNPKALESVTVEKKSQSKLAQALKDIS